MSERIHNSNLDIGLQLAKNSLSSVIAAVIIGPVTLALTFYIIKYIGKIEFGIWTIVGVVLSYAQLGDFLTAEGLVKFIAEYKAQNDVRKLNQLINTAISLTVIISILICTLFIVFLPFIINNILHIPAEFQYTTLYILKIAIILFFINMITRIFGSLIIGFQRMDYSNLILIVFTLITAMFSLVFLSKGYGLFGLIYSTIIGTFFLMCSNIFIAWRLFPQMRIRLVSYFSKEVLKLMLNFGWKIQLSNISQLMVFRIDTILLSHYVGLTAVSYYEVANRLASFIRGAIILILNPLMPAASALEVYDKAGKISGLYKRSFKYISIIAIPFSFLIIIFAHPFVRTWMGPGYETSAFTLQLLMTIYMINIFTGPGSFILCGINKPHIGMKSAILAGILNVFLCILFVKSVGYYGVILGILISMLVGTFYFIWMVHHTLFGLAWSIYPENLLRPSLYAGFFGAILMILDAVFQFKGYLILGTIGVFYLVTNFIMILHHKNYFDDYDRVIFNNFNPLRIIKL